MDTLSPLLYYLWMHNTVALRSQNFHRILLSVHTAIIHVIFFSFKFPIDIELDFIWNNTKIPYVRFNGRAARFTRQLFLSLWLMTNFPPDLFALQNNPYQQIYHLQSTQMLTHLSSILHMIKSYLALNVDYYRFWNCYHDFSSGMLKLIVSKCVRNENSISTDGNIQSCTLKQKGLGPLKIGIYQTDPN